MNAGFSNLATLKSQLLASTLGAESRFDTVLLAIGLGAAAAIANGCHRQFDRVVGATEILPADRCQFLLSRYPVESLASVELKLTETDGFVELEPGSWLTVDQVNGIVNFPERADVGPYYAQVRFTFSGGYWWETAEPDDADFPHDLPTGANALPPDLRLAWLLHCEGIWAKRDKLGMGLVDAPEAQSKVAALELPPAVKQMLSQFIRYNLV